MFLGKIQVGVMCVIFTIVEPEYRSFVRRMRSELRLMYSLRNEFMI